MTRMATGVSEYPKLHSSRGVELSSDPDDSALACDFRPLSEARLPYLLTAPEAAAHCRVSLRTWRSWDAAARVPSPIRIGRAKLWRPLELADWIAAGCPDRSVWRWESRAE
jgi:hypothetical protein